VSGVDVVAMTCALTAAIRSRGHEGRLVVPLFPDSEDGWNVSNSFSMFAGLRKDGDDDHLKRTPVPVKRCGHLSTADIPLLAVTADDGG